MYYPQSTKEIRLVMLSFDDVMYDLTHLRYNYYRRLCRLYHTQLNKQEFIHHLGNASKMFEQCPIDDNLLKKDAMIQKIESDLYAYCKMYGLKHKDGLVEIMELLAQRKIPCVAFSSHELKYTQALMGLAVLFNKPQVLIGEHSSLDPLPSGQMFDLMVQQYHVKPENTLIVCSTLNAVIAANKVRANVVFIPDLQKATKEIEIRSLKVCSSLLDVLNLLLEGRLSKPNLDYMLVESNRPSDIYAHYQTLVERYKDDVDTSRVLDQIYQEEYAYAQKYYVEEAIEEPVIEEPVIEEPVIEEPVIEEPVIEEPVIEEPVIEEPVIEEPKIEEPVIEEADIEDVFKRNPLEEMGDDNFNIDQLEVRDTEQRTFDTYNVALQSMIDDIEGVNEPLELKKENVEVDKTKTMMFTKEELKFLGFKEKDLLKEDEDLETYLEENERERFPFSNIIFDLIYAVISAIIAVGLTGVLVISMQEVVTGTFVESIIAAIDTLALKLFIPLSTVIAGLFSGSEVFIEALCNVFLLTIVFWIIYIIRDIFKFKRHH